MNHMLKKSISIGITIVGFSAIIGPSGLYLTSCTSSHNNSQPEIDSSSHTIPLASIQAQADQIDNPDDAIAFLNQTLARYYTYDMFKEDIVHAINHYHKDIAEFDDHNPPGTNQTMLSDEYASGIDFIEPNADHRTINFNTFSYAIGTMVGGSVYSKQFYKLFNIPFVPVLVNVKGTVYLGFTSPLNDSSFYFLEPEGNVSKSFFTQIGDDENNVCEGHIGPLVGTTTCWIKYQSKNFPQKVIWNYAEFSYFDKMYNHWDARYQEQSIVWFVSKYFPLKFPNIQVSNSQNDHNS